MILITGASSGIGLSTAEYFAENKKNLILVARRKDRLKKTAELLSEKHGVEVQYFGVDVSNKNAVVKWKSDAAALLSQVDCLVNNAGLATTASPIQEGKSEDWDLMFDTNCKGFLYMVEAILPHFLKNKKGHFINIGSVAGRWIYPNGNVYCATKSAVKSINESLRMDLHGSGIRVTEIAPGIVETEFSLVRFKGDAEKANLMYSTTNPLYPRDIAENIYWAYSRPPHVNIQEIVIYPTDQGSISQVLRSK